MNKEEFEQKLKNAQNVIDELNNSAKEDMLKDCGYEKDDIVLYLDDDSVLNIGVIIKLSPDYNLWNVSVCVYGLKIDTNDNKLYKYGGRYCNWTTTSKILTKIGNIDSIGKIDKTDNNTFFGKLKYFFKLWKRH